MEDLENRLSAIGYRPLQKSAECWQVSRVGAVERQLRACAPRLSEGIALQPVLRFWLRRLGRFDASPLYRIRRAI